MTQILQNDDLPNGWILTTIGELCTVKSGGTPSRSKPEYWNGKIENWTNKDQSGSGMDIAVQEIVAWLENETVFEYDPAESVHVLEAIAAFHASHKKNSAWVELPLTGNDLEIGIRSG